MSHSEKPNLVLDVVETLSAEDFEALLSEIVSFDDGVDITQDMVFAKATRRIAEITGLSFAPARSICKNAASNRAMRELLQIKSDLRAEALAPSLS